MADGRGERMNAKVNIEKMSALLVDESMQYFSVQIYGYTILSITLVSIAVAE